MSDPSVSVLMAVNRRDAFLSLAIESIIQQTFSNFEFIIVANNCNDDLWTFLKSIKDPRIVLFRVPLGGLANSLNFGICHAKGKYIARMDADDVSLPSRLYTQYNFLESNPSVVLLGCDSILIDDYGNPISQKFKFYQDNFSIRKMLPIRNTILHPAIMVRSSLLLSVGGYKYGHMSEDHELFIRIARDKNNHFHNLGEVLFHYRRHSNQITDISNVKKNFCEISGFLFTEFLLTMNFKYIMGMCVVSPIGRNFINIVRFIKLRFF